MLVEFIVEVGSCAGCCMPVFLAKGMERKSEAAVNRMARVTSLSVL
jgi:hypothetical protein